ncbi:Ig-like domain-containing protein [Microlunatus panaciterrae]|uniref:Lipoprotein-anchoring transpeptidase ErfK/SrfK n=1 Tax=Microlunatus panaciterrae TaxID=400768 RepID=A0ABS2RG83_9ACTN|nr:Ig-like domain-containing protein [Microlunatus panaciterrae]MBM7798015.1 lipoprotein-anchoring transpeptidase ErfK/SrfK [Microlunatus panaciterrae]
MQSEHMTRTGRWQRTGLAVTALALAAALAGCGSVPTSQGTETDGGGRTSSSTSAPAQSEQPTPSPTPDPVVFTSNVEDHATDVKVDTTVAVKASGGTVSSVKLAYSGKDADGNAKTMAVPGHLNKAHTAWSASTGLDPATRYRLVMTGTSDQGVKTTTRSSFTTQQLSLDQQTFPTLYPLSGQKVGVGMPVIITFDVAVKDKAEFEKHLSVTTSPRQQGTWHWVSDTEVHFRPKHFWKPGTKVTVDANLNGVNAGGGIYGQHSRSTSFTIGRSVVTKIDLKRDKAKVYINGKLSRTIKVSGGKPGFTTRSGTKLIMAKLRTTKMASETIGIADKNSPNYYSLDVEYAMRITSSGEFLHAAPWNMAVFGRTNASHGCVGMSTADARWLFNTVSIGDPTITTGTSRGLEQGNGWSDWDVSYAKYKQGSAL